MVNSFSTKVVHHVQNILYFPKASLLHTYILYCVPSMLCTCYNKRALHREIQSTLRCTCTKASYSAQTCHSLRCHPRHFGIKYFSRKVLWSYIFVVRDQFLYTVLWCTANQTRNIGADPPLFQISAQSYFRCITQHTEPTAYGPPSIMIKCLAIGHKCHDQDSNLHSAE